jgi:tRNA pseudouridine55 synthase
MDGKPLYEYAREGIPLPRPIEPRTVVVSSLEVTQWLGSDHNFKYPTKEMPMNEKQALEKAAKVTIGDAAEQQLPDSGSPTAFVLKMTVSGGICVVHSLYSETAYST